MRSGAPVAQGPLLEQEQRERDARR
jgi:hypothetical protein